MSLDFLVDHALKNVWCTPNQDLQSIVKPARLTPINGVWNTVRVLWRKHRLPEQSVRFHVYQIGQLHPLLMGLFESDNKWSTLAEACNQKKMIIDVYSAKGVQMPRTQCWFMITLDKNLILAVKEQDKIAFDLNTEDLFIRVYSNAYFHSNRSDPLNDYIEVRGGVVNTTNDILVLQNRFNDLSALPGAVYAFVNGMKVNAINLFSVRPDDAVEYIYDSSILQVLDFPVDSLLTFDSTLDNKFKYLLHYPGAGNNTIDFHDDVDVFIYKPGLNGNSKGIYYHRNQPDALRMLSHKDYSIPSAYVVAYADAQPDWTVPEQLTVRLHIRKSGYDRFLIDEDNRIKELYKLPDEKIVAAMIGIDATVVNWTAASLEDSFYTELMRKNLIGVTRQLTQDAYGYNAISKLLGDTPTAIRDVNGNLGIDVPHGLFRNSTAYEYDINGKLLDYHFHNLGTVYLARNAAAKLVEMVAGVGDFILDEVYGDMVVTLDPTADYRMYVCPKVNGVPTNVWVDVTGGGQYAKINNTLTWLINPTEFYPLVRSNKKILTYTLQLNADDGLLRFSFNTDQKRGDVTTRWVMQIPMGELDLWLNGYSLIEDVDYVVNFPEVVIINKKYLSNPLTQTQRIDIRFSGFCTNTLQRFKPNDRGFIKYGVLSHNNRFDIRDDKVMRIVVGGKCMHRDSLSFSESDSSVTVPNALNGVPYMLRDIVVPLKGVAVDDTYTLRAKSKVIDQRISDYLSVMIPEAEQTGPNVIETLYPVYSPFCCKIIYDLINGDLVDARMTQNYNDTVVTQICQPYEYLLNYDPTQEGHTLDGKYVIVHPHNLTTTLTMNLYQYKFVLRVIRLYLNDTVTLNNFVTLSS